MSSFVIRMARPQDGSQLAEIYEPYCSTPVSFESTPPDGQEMATRLGNLLPVYPWLVAVEGQQLLGYAYAAPHRQRAAYGWTVETSVYLRASCQGRGVGRALYQRLLEILQRQGFCTVLAGLTLPNPASLRLHERMGFEEAALYPAVGFKAGQWHTTRWLSLSLNPEQRVPGTPLLLSEIGELSDPPFGLETARLIMCPLGPAHAEAMLAFVESERERLQEGFPLMVRQVVDLSSARQFVRDKSIQWSRQESYSFGMWRRGGEHIGYLSLKHFDPSVPKADMGYCLVRRAEGQGLMSEAIGAVLPFAFGQLGLGRLYLRIHPENRASQRVAEKCGFTYEGRLRDDFRDHHGQLQDMNYYGLTASQYQAAASQASVPAVPNS